VSLKLVEALEAAVTDLAPKRLVHKMSLDMPLTNVLGLVVPLTFKAFPQLLPIHRRELHPAADLVRRNALV